MTTRTSGAAKARTNSPRRRGLTLIELMVVLVLLAILASVVGLSVRTAQPVSGLTPTEAHLAAIRDSATRSGHAVSAQIATPSGLRDATAYPDGRLIADPEFNVNPLTGLPRSVASGRPAQ